jgi:3-oxoacyl-[acyl-carrier protein] reductase
MNYSNQKKIAIVTGAAGGFGREIVRHLLQAGFRVVATDTNKDRLLQLTKEADSQERLQCLYMDVVNVDSIYSVVEQVNERFSGAEIAILVNNAGIFERTPILFTDCFERVQKTLDINLLGTYYCTSIFARQMVKHKFGRIINISSIAGTWGAALASAYAASKAGMIAAAQSWARELAPYGICANAIAPGVFQTQMLDQAEPKGPSFVEKQLTDFIPARRLGSPKDVAELVTFLAQCQTDYLNGTVFTLDGGLQTGTVETTLLESAELLHK